MSVVSIDVLIRPGGEDVPGTLDTAKLRADVIRLAHAVHRHGGGDWLIHEPDPHQFVVALYGTILGGGNAVLLPGDRPGGAEGVESARRLGAGGTAVAALAAGIEARAEPPAVVPGTVVTLTSGSTGARKRLSRGLDHLLAEARALQAMWPGGERSITASMVSSHHMYGLMFAVVWPLSTGSRILGAPVSPAPDFAALDNDRQWPVRLVTSPSYLHRMESSIDMSRFSDRAGKPIAVRQVFSAGAPLDAAAARFAAARLDADIVEIYGSTETGAVATRRADRGEPWVALPGVAIDAHDGHLAINAPYLATEVPRPYVSADRARFDGERFELLGRSDRVVKIEGKRVSLQEIEDSARQIGCVIDCAAGVEPRKNGRTALALVLDQAGVEKLLAGGKAAFDADVRGVLARDLESVAVPRRIRYLSRIPRDLNAKLRADVLSQTFAEGARARPTVHGESRHGEWLELELALDPDLLAFTGHFPGFAVLPGVALIHWAAHNGAVALDADGVASRLQDVKFMHILTPNDPLNLSIRRQRRGIEFRFRRGETLCAKGRIMIDESG